MTMPGKMTKFRITELSGVTRPCQDGARAVIMKVADGAELPTIDNSSDIEKALKGFHRCTDKAFAKAHIIARAQALGATAQLPDSWVEKADPGQRTDNEGDSMSSAIKKALGLADTATDAEVEAAITKNAADAAAATKATAVLKAKSDMTDKEKAFMDGKDDDAVCKFMAQTPTQRADEIAKAAAGDESIVIEGQTIRKSAVGDSMFAIMKAQAKRIDDNEAAIAKAAETAANATFTKLATEKFPTLVGSVDERASVLKFLSTAPEDVRKAADAILAAAEATAKLAFSKLGTLATDEDGAIIEKDDSKPEVTKSGAKLEKLAKDLAAKETGLTFAKAYDRVALEHPELYEKALAGE